MKHAATNSQDQEALKAVVAGFRVALELGDLPLVSLAAFPHGSCGDVCELLGQFLIDSGFGEWRYCSGQRDDSFFTHAWLERDGLILDITADQFPDIDQPVLLTRGRAWHNQFSLHECRRAANLDHLFFQDFAADAEWTYRELYRRFSDRAGLP
ncbi:hypothetical protein [Micromonospora arida]|uniref:hypothetical protein n=1 Tax=Micromonospora arida TaxID=2203715 RepID=UPI0033B5F1B2